MDPDDPFSDKWNSVHLRPPHLEFFESTETNGLFKTYTFYLILILLYYCSYLTYSWRVTVACARQAVMIEHRANKIRHLLFVEMTLLSKFFETRKNKYRSDKGFKTIAKVSIT